MKLEITETKYPTEEEVAMCAQVILNGMKYLPTTIGIPKEKKLINLLIELKNKINDESN